MTETTITRFTNRHLQADGSSTEHRLTETDGRFDLITTVGGGSPTTRHLGTFAGGLTEALQAEPALLTVGTGFTDITTDGPIDTHGLLGLLVVDDPAAEEPDVDDWLTEEGDLRVDLDIDPDEWTFASEQIHTMRTTPDYDIVARWIRVNGQRAFVLRGSGFAAVGLAHEDSEWQRPDTTGELLTWGFYRESGGPCTFDGGAEVAWCGPRLWVFHRWGDYDPEVLVFRAPEPAGMVGELGSAIEGLGWLRPYLLDAVGLPGLSEEDREALRSGLDVEGETVSSHLEATLDEEVVELFCATYPPLREVVDGLRDPESERGRLIYAWVNQVIHGPYQSGSWTQVYDAMYGQIEPPAEDQRRPTSEERIKDQVERVVALMEDEHPSE